MKLSPVKNYTANYPDKTQVDLNHMLLQHHPARWKTSSAAWLMLSALAAAQLTGCKANYKMESQTATRKMNMAPIFQNDTVTYPLIIDPMFSSLSFQDQKSDIVQLGNYPGFGLSEPLTEEAALAIIHETLQEQGLESTTSTKRVDVPIGDNYTKWTFDMEVTGANEPVYIEFLAQIYVNDNIPLERSALKLPIESYEPAVALREKLSEVYDDSTGVIFYTNDGDHILMRSPESQLTAQVNDFVEWLKTEGLI